MLGHGIDKRLKSLLRIVVPCLSRKECDIRITVIFDQVVYKKLYRIVVIREDRREVLALLIDEDDRAFAAVVDHLLDAVRQAR